MRHNKITRTVALALAVFIPGTLAAVSALKDSSMVVTLTAEKVLVGADGKDQFCPCRQGGRGGSYRVQGHLLERDRERS